MKRILLIVKSHAIVPIQNLGIERFGTDDLDLLQRPVTTICSSIANPVNDVHSVHDLSEHSVLAIQVRRWRQTDEELAAVGAWAAVCHGQYSFTSMLE